MPKMNKLSIYLIKDEYAKDDKKILKDSKFKLGEIENVGTVYYAPSSKSVPKWLDTFYCGEISTEKIFTSNVRVVFVVRVDVGKGNVKAFAITMGYGKFLLENDVVENDFGIKVVLNTITSDSLRRINKINIGGNQKSSNEQLPLSSEIEDFGFDIDRDMISAITGYSADEEFSKGMISGGDLLSLSAAVDITNLKDFLKKVYEKYCSSNYRTNFSWIDHIKKVKDSKLITKLEQKTIELINDESPNIWMAVPDVIDWERIKGFKYTKEEIQDDIEILEVVKTLKKGLVSYEQLRSKTISAISTDDDHSIYMSWKAHRCLVGEVEVDNKAYCINNGQWYCIDKDFVEIVNKDYENISVSDMEFMNCTKIHSTENKYTTAFVETMPDYLLCMDREIIQYGGGRSKIELCDILTVDKKYIHIKPYSGSGTLSHLFNQAVVSAELVLSDRVFLEKANEKIAEQTENEKFLIDEKNRPHIILAIISKSEKERPEIPFFSKVALRYTKRRLETFGCVLEIKNIHKIEDK